MAGGTNLGASTNFPQGFAYGLSVRGMPLLQMQPGQVFFVGNSMILNPNQRAGSDSNRGTLRSVVWKARITKLLLPVSAAVE